MESHLCQQKIGEDFFCIKNQADGNVSSPTKRIHNRNHISLEFLFNLDEATNLGAGECRVDTFHVDTFQEAVACLNREHIVTTKGREHTKRHLPLGYIPGGGIPRGLIPKMQRITMSQT